MEETRLLDESSQKLKAILDVIGEGISIIDDNLKIVRVNPIIEKWAGPLDDLKGRYCYIAYQKRDTPCENCPTIKAFKTGKVERARQHAYDCQGNIRYFEFTSAPIFDQHGRITSVVELAVDLTEKIELEQKLKETRDRLQAIFDSISDGISVIDKNYQILRVNREILNMFNKRGFSDPIGKKCFVEYYNSDEPCDNCPGKKAMEEGKPYRITKIWQGSEKGRVALDISAFPIKDENGDVIQVIEYIRDITHMVRLEDQLLYQERLRGIGELAAGIAHEIRNPLGNIAALGQFCLSKYKLPEPVRRHLKIILKNSENANKIVRDLLDFARPREISFKMGNIGDVIDRACSLVKTKCSRQRIRLIKRWSRRLPQILLDEKFLKEAFLNFILNALDAMPNGGRLTITAYADSSRNEIVVNFLDAGDGIPQNNLDKIFDPFFTTKKEGIGLGLTLAQQVINYHKGKIEIESEAGKGTNVIVGIPIARETAEQDKGLGNGFNPNS